MKNIIIAILVIFLIGAIGYIFYQQGYKEALNKTSPEMGEGVISDNIEENFIEKNKTADSVDKKLIGGDKDDHGCLIGAGYTWCEEKQKCLRDWEEDCDESSEGGIIKALAVAHKKDVSEVSIRITQESEGYARGGVEFAPGGPGNAGMFLATNKNGEWEIVYDGNGNPDCENLENEYNFPKEMLKGFCY